MKMKADLHCHTTGSDGRHNLDYLLEMYSKKGYGIVAITDHYTIADSIRDDKIIKIKEGLYDLKVIIGMEAIATINGEHVHMLCYFNKNEDLSDKILNYLSGQEDFTSAFNERVKSIMKEQGVDIPDIDYNLLDRTSYYPILTEVVKRTGSTIRDTRRKFFTYMEGIGVPEDKKLAPTELIEEVHKSKGLVFVAHPYEFKHETVLEAIKLGVDSIEAIYPSYSEEQKEALISLAKERNILYSAGSDFHCTIVDNPKHGEIGSVSLEGEPLNKFMARLTGDESYLKNN